MLAVVRERAASQDLPGKPLLWHLTKTARVGKILVRKGLDRFKELGIHLLLFAEYIVQRPVPLLCEDDRVALIFG